MTVMLRTEGLAKQFTLHLQGGVRLPVLQDVDFAVHAGECIALSGPSGAGKSTLLRALYGNYRADAGNIWVRHDGEFVDIAAAPPRMMLDVRKRTLGYVSQFLRVVPRVPALKIVAEAGAGPDAAVRAKSLLRTLNIPSHLHALPPATFSGGEQQRVNIARGFAGGHALLILDEPTASLDAKNRDAVVELIAERRASGTGFLAIFHDEDVRARLADRMIDVSAFSTREAA